MKTIAPEYYPFFRCIAGACRHSCCVGWEIDIDEDTCGRYLSETGAFGARLRENIDCGDACASFRLDERERCPFLNADGLCDIILTLGEDALCQICTDHPRFRADFADRTELGLGLCCEAAAELILTWKEPVRLITLTDDGGDEQLTEAERRLLSRRESLISLAQDRSRSVEERMGRISREAGIPSSGRTFVQWTAEYRALEQLDPRWDVLLRRAETAETTRKTALDEGMREQLLVYFLYRHLTGAEDDRDFAARAGFAVHCVRFISALCTRLPEESPTEIARMFSSEIEYSEENTQALLAQCCPGVSGGETSGLTV